MNTLVINDTNYEILYFYADSASAEIAFANKEMTVSDVASLFSGVDQFSILDEEHVTEATFKLYSVFSIRKTDANGPLCTLTIEPIPVSESQKMTDRINKFESKINAQAEILDQQSNKIDRSQENLTAFRTIMSSFVRSQVGTLPSNSVISITTFLPEWSPKKWEKDSACQYNGKPYKCVTAHDSTANPDWNPTVRSLFVPYHATAPEYALPYDQPTMAEDAYNTGEYMIWTDGTIRKCLKNATVNGADVLPDSWETVEY